MKKYIIYLYLKAENDIKFIEELDTREQVSKKYNLNFQAVSQYYFNLEKDEQPKHLINDKYCIVLDKEL